MEASRQAPIALPRPWMKFYPEHYLDQPFVGCFNDGLSMFRRAVATAGDSAAIHYFDRTLSYAELDRLSDAFAGFLLDKGVNEGDRVALYLQNVPQFVICLLGAWKIGAIGVSINPMNRSRELTLLLRDSGARVLVLHRDLYKDVAESVLTAFPQVCAVTTSARDYQSRNDARVINVQEPLECQGSIDLVGVLLTGSRAAGLHVELAPEKPAMIVYTSGTTGMPKGAVITHANFSFDSALWREWMGMRDKGPILAIAPLFHITGLVGHIGAAFATCAPIILSMRFHPAVVADAAQEHQAEFMVGAITAFIAIMNSPEVRPEQFKTLKKAYTGGAPVPAKVAHEFSQKYGLPIRNTYGMTETSSLIVGVPFDLDTPVDSNGSYSVGVPVFSSDAYIADEIGQPLPAGEVGEIYLRGPQVISEYWQRPDATSEAFYNGYLRTGDVGYMNDDGWIFIVDRKKDMISASGYKVWPKEVEDVIYTHPAIREVAVIGVKDEYRGETVKAVVSLRPGQSVEPEALIAYCKERMAAYKYPRQVEIIEDLPKTATGKILRRELR
jgi:long-chain acyl-CoA synthetase